METLKGLISLDFSLDVQRTALSGKYCSILGNHEIDIYLPQLPEQLTESGTNYLLPPQKCNVKLPAEDTWGLLRSYNSKNYLAESCCVSINQFYFECQIDDFALSCEQIKLSVDNWRKRFYQVLCLETKCDYGYNGYITNPGQGIHLFVTEPSFNRYNIGLPGEMAFIVREYDNCLNQDQLRGMLINTNLNNSLKLEYELLVQAYQEMSNKNYRYSLIQAISAVEICIGNKINSLCIEKGIDGNILIGKKSLGDKFEILRAFGLNWPTKNPNEEITKYRNDLFHSRMISPKYEVVREVIEKVRLYIDSYSPGFFI